MAITNQQIADCIQETIKQMSSAIDDAVTQVAEIVRELSAAQDRRADSYEKAILEISRENRAEHTEFRKAIADLTTAVQLMKAAQDRHDDNWKRLWGLLVAIVLVPVGIEVINLVIH